MSGFDHFDRAHQENFCASLLLLLFDLVPNTRGAVGALFGGAAGLPGTARLKSYTREVSMVGEDEGRRPRADLVLTYNVDGTPYVVLVEVKSHGGWTPGYVEIQATEQARSVLKATGARPNEVVVLAPERLSDAVKVPSVAWRDVLAALHEAANTREVDATARDLVERTIGHLQRHVVKEPDAGDAATASVGAAIQTVAALDGLVRDCVQEVGGKTQGLRPYLPPGGNPYRTGGWAYQAIQRKVTVDGATYWFGVYCYEQAPEGRTDAVGPWLEAYAEGDNGVRASIPLGKENLTLARLRVLRSKFKQDWEQRHAKTGS